MQRSVNSNRVIVFSARSSLLTEHETMDTTMRSGVSYVVRAEELLAGRNLELS
jgi:hypothetical protein